ncbi:MAG: NADH-quinone oxidoreductase subunit L [Verrucomicrobia bacterium]|nr:NADH-quinone oxidoreductase subunit L [Verrucomicrobiota bacterium]
MTAPAYAWLILFLPLFSAVAITLGARRSPQLSALISIGAVAGSFLLTVALALSAPPGSQGVELSVRWMEVAGFQADFGFRVDTLSLLMLLVVTGVGTAIHAYSFGYMSGDPGFARFFGSLSLFMFSMLGIVVSTNFLQMFIFWELVGVSSYLLIGFWHEKPAAADACKKAFLTNRLGDFGFILGILIVWSATGTLHFTELAKHLETHPAALGSLASLAALLVFCGAMGKSAQFPLHVWLPDAMEGPTPVSALIHAATMVAAGVFMLCRMFFLFQLPASWPEALAFLHGWSAADIVAWIGGFTALLAALMAMQQDDIKRILAYSTLSQLGYMVMGVGVGGPAAAMFHLSTHAFFKALLFLGAGSVIHALHHEQDIWKMGGLRRSMPVTFWTFLIGTAALCGVPPLSGFYSKDAVLAAASHGNPVLFALAVTVAGMTAFYMSRLFLVAFLGSPRSDHASHAHESPPVMSYPLLLLAVPSVIAGFFGLEERFTLQFLPPSAVPHGPGHGFDPFAPFGHAPAAAMFGLGATLFGVSFAAALYGGASRDPLPAKLGALARAMRARFYFDELYEKIGVRLHDALAALAGWIDRWIIAGLGVKGAHGTVDLAGRALRLFQTGSLQTYAFFVVAGLVLMLLMTLVS